MKTDELTARRDCRQFMQTVAITNTILKGVKSLITNNALFLLLLVTITCLSAGTALAQTWRLTGPPAFVPSQDDPFRGGIFQPGTSRNYASGEGLVTTTLNSRTASSAAFTTTHERYGTSSISYSWDSPPEVLHTGDVVAFNIRWNIGQKYSRFCPQMGTLTHLDWSTDWYTTQCYGELCATPLTSGQVSNTVITVTSNNATQLVFYVDVHSTPGNVRVQWTYRLVALSAPSAATTTPPAKTPGGVNNHRNAGVNGKEEKIFENGNIYGVNNGPVSPTQFTLSKATFIIRVENYHYFNKGKLPGTITLVNSNGKQFGSWQATGTTGQGGVQNAYWVVRPNINLPAGTYTVIDSDPATWSTNTQSANKGFTVVWAAGQHTP